MPMGLDPLDDDGALNECLGRDAGPLDDWRSRLREVNVSALWSHSVRGLPWRAKLNICYEVDTADNNLCDASRRRLSDLMMAFASTLLPLVYAAHQNDNNLDPRGNFARDFAAKVPAWEYADEDEKKAEQARRDDFNRQHSGR